MGVQLGVLRQPPVDRRVFVGEVRVLPQCVLVKYGHPTLPLDAERSGIGPSGAGGVQDAPEYDEGLSGQERGAGWSGGPGSAEVGEGNKQEEEAQ